MEKMSIKKAEMSFARKSFLGLLTGLWMALAGCFSLSVAGMVCCLLSIFVILGIHRTKTIGFQEELGTK